MFRAEPERGVKPFIIISSFHPPAPLSSLTSFEGGRHPFGDIVCDRDYKIRRFPPNMSALGSQVMLNA